MKFNDEERALMLESLEYTKRAFENYAYYPSYEFKCQQVAKVKNLISKIRNGTEEECQQQPSSNRN